MCSIKRGITLLYYLCKRLFLDDFNLEEINFHCFGSLEEKSKLKKNIWETYWWYDCSFLCVYCLISYKYITIVFNLYLSIYILRLSVCLFVPNERLNSVVSKFCVGPHMTPGKYMNAQNYKICVQKFLIFVKSWKKIYWFNFF